MVDTEAPVGAEWEGPSLVLGASQGLGIASQGLIQVHQQITKLFSI